MKVQFKVTEITSKEDYTAAKLEPNLVDARTGDSVAGGFFLNTLPENGIFSMGDLVEIVLVPVIEEPIV